MWYNKIMKKFPSGKSTKRYESFKIDLGLMELIRRFARRDNRTIKATIDITMREGFKARGFDAKV